ncbi:MAG: S-layer homology domain-containing protein [Ruminococcaceae bacterium]|nr:S-layer homology domain-containing protein [Oscillospiraceae bacterium]
MKRTKKLLVLLISVAALMAMMVLAVSADNPVYYVGDTITAPSCIHDKPGYVSYGQWLLYDETAVERTSSGELRFLKTGDIEIKRTTESCKTTNQHDKKISHEYFRYTVKEKTTISDTTLTVDSGAFCGGKPFPEFTLEANAPYTIEEVSFYHEMCDYYPGDILPSSRAGEPVPMIYLKLIPKQGYSFAFTGTADDTYEDSKYTVVYKGKSYSARVKRSITSAENALSVWIDGVTFESGQIYARTISDLTAPYHNGPLDKTVTVASDVELVSVRYFRLIKEVTSFAAGEYAYIDVTLKSKDPRNTFSADSYIYWKEESLKSEKTTLISPTEATFRFKHMTEALPENMIGVVNLSVSEPQTNAVVSHTAANADTFGITVNNLSWTPDDETFGGGVAYTAKVEFTVAGTYTFVDSFLTNGVVYINGETASVVQKTVKTLNGRPRPVENTYIASFTFPETEIVVPNFRMEAIGETDLQLYEAGKAFTLKVKVTDNGEINADFQWYRCDASGKTLSAYPNLLSMGDSLTVSAGIPAAEMLETRYYRADACIGDTVKSIVFSVTLCPMGVEEEEYVFPFTDCGGHWGYSYIEASHKMGLLNGTTATTYAPNTDLTVAAAVKLAVCMNILYNGGDPNNDISVGKDVWYSTYMAYALEHGIIDTDLSSRQAEKITRSEYVYMFSRALPAEAFKEINTFAVGDIPDVKSCNTKYEQAIYKFYRAGIVIGNSAGEFMPDNTISRAEVATILVRMMDTSFRSKK